MNAGYYYLEQVDLFVVFPSLHPDVEFIRTNSRFQLWRLDFIGFLGLALLCPHCVGTNVGIEDGDCNIVVLMARDLGTVRERTHQLRHLRLQFSLLEVIKNMPLMKDFANSG